MISYQVFEEIVAQKTGRDIGSNDDIQQHRAIVSSKDSSLFIVAGPGSGKTTVMVLKILKFIFVDDVDPANILATTFTNKAASELCSRIYDWGNKIIKFLEVSEHYDDIKDDLESIDLNQIITGTLDSICYEVLNNFRDPGAAPPVLIDEYVAKRLMLSYGLFHDNRYENPDLEDFLKQISGSNRRLNASGKTDLLLEIKNRLYNDNIDFEEFCNRYKHNGTKIACKAISSYIKILHDNEILDYTTLEQEFLNKIKGNRLNKFLDNIQIILVDEYQDTNSLQESIYFELAKAAIRNVGGMTVVGDDDQSLYRFRGATVDLFVNFRERFEKLVGENTELIKLSNNYRSTKEIVDFCNEFINLDKDYMKARVADKKDIVSARKEEYVHYPLLGIFREDLQSLSEAIASFIDKVLHNKLIIDDIELSVDHYRGSENDLSFLFASPNEFNSYHNAKLPYQLKNELSLLKVPIKIFNPRGQNLEKIDDVSILCGLILECIDPLMNIQEQMENIPKDANFRLKTWRERAYDYLSCDPEPNEPLPLREFLYAWQDRKPIGRNKWKKYVPLLDLVYKLVLWIPSMQNDIEGLVYLESINRTINQSTLFSTYESKIVFKNQKLEDKSIEEALWNIFIPLASGAIDIDEGLFENLPQDRINLMSIHQSKGLEFPLIFIDVCSEFNSDHNLQRFKRFPKEGNKDCNMENELRKYSKSLGVPERSSIDRSFDDLIRKYFVAFSRAQDVLVLVGLKSCYEKSIPNIATGWNRKKEWIKFSGIKQI